MVHPILQDSQILQNDNSCTEDDPLLKKVVDVIEPGDEPREWQKPPGLLWIELAILSNVFLSGFDGTVTASTYAVITSEFRGSNLAAWITTSYLVTSTALQPLYGRFSDLFGRRICLFVATILFGLGCLGCALAPDLATLIMMRGVTGLGGGGLMTMATIINSDIIPAKHRGMYQAVQNILHGLGAISGASVGGVIADAIGWRFCFLLQVPISFGALIIARSAIKPGGHVQIRETVPGGIADEDSPRRAPSLWKHIDMRGSLFLFSGIFAGLVALSCGSNSLAWNHPLVILSSGGSLVLLIAFVFIEKTTKAIPIMPLSLITGIERGGSLFCNICLGVSGYGFLFLMPLFFQAVLLDSASVAGLRLVAPSLATPVGGLVTGLLMRQGTNLHIVTIVGLASLAAGGYLNLCLRMNQPTWMYSVLLVVGGFGQGMAYPAGLFSFLKTCTHKEHAVATSLVYLVRSVGAVCGVAFVSTITQAILANRLETAFSGLPDGHEIIIALTQSVEAIRELPADLRFQAQVIYYDACRTGLAFLFGLNVVSLICGICVFIWSRRRNSEGC